MAIPALSRPALGAVLRSWDLAVEGECQVATKGVENTNIFFVSGGARWVLQVHGGRSFAAVQRQAAILEHLGAASLPVPRLHPARRGRRVARAWGQPATVLSFLEGVDFEGRPPNVQSARAIGDLVGRVDRALARLPIDAMPSPPHELTSLGETRRRLTRLLRDERARAPAAGVAIPWPAITSAFDRVDTPGIARLWRALPRQLIHGDVSAQNLLHEATSGRLTGLLDLGDVVTSARVADLAVTLCHLGFGGRRILHDSCAALWAGWSEIVAPTAAERAALPSLVTSRFVKLVVDHAWRDWYRRPHAGHRPLIAAGVDGLAALLRSPNALDDLTGERP
ncbi:MAG TPA: phosphotransferase [Polyangia bacterium]